MPHIWREQILNWAGGALVAAMPFLANWLQWYPAETGRIHLYGDFIEHLGTRSYWYNALTQGKLPLWDAWHDTGLPFLSYLFDLFNPVILLYGFFLEDGLLTNHVMQIMMLAHLSIGAVGAYLWGLSWGKGRTAAAIMGLIWGLNGFFMVKTTGHDLVIHTTAWFPYVFMFLERARAKSSLIQAAWGGVFLAMVFMGGHPQFFYYLALALAAHLVYWIAQWLREGGVAFAWGRAWRLYLPLGLAAALCAAPSLAHFVTDAFGELSRVHPSGDLGDLIFTQRSSGQPRLWAYFWLPGLEGGAVETFVDVGLIPLVAALLAMFHIRGRTEGYYKLLLFMGLVLMLGGFFGLHKVLVDVLPGYVYFQETRRWIILSILALTALAGCGVHWLLAAPRPLVGPAALMLGRLFWFLAAGFLAVLIVYHLGLDMGRQAGVLNSLSMALLLSAVAWLVLKRVEADQRGPALRVLIVAVVGLHLAFFPLSQTIYEYKHYRPDPSRLSPQQDQQARDLAELAWGQPWRFLLEPGEINQSAQYRHGVMRLGDMPPHVTRVFPRDFWEIRWRPGENPRFLNLFSARFVPCGRAEALADRDTWKVVGFSQAAARLGTGQDVGSVEILARSHFAQDAMAGELVAELGLVRRGRLIAHWPLFLGRQVDEGWAKFDLPRISEVDEVLIASAHPKVMIEVEKLKVNGLAVSDSLPLARVNQNMCENRSALPLVRFVSRASVVGPRAEYIDAVASVDPALCVIFRSSPPDYVPPDIPTPNAGGEVKLLAHEPQKLQVQVKAQQTGYAVMAQTAFPGWSARLDGEPARILMAYGFMAAVQVPEGVHMVEFTYDEPLVRFGIWLAPISFLALVVWSLLAWRRRRPENAS